ncbi:MAG: hypothetical protein INH41_19030 [Myxococcaceae bacterium]|nr:hypothetical protein [Myxococcaceae bacterium]MCA3014481.1 hypothetical protein [Myxococcaceae bacterium]
MLPSIITGVLWGAFAFFLAVGRVWWPRLTKWLSVTVAVLQFVAIIALVAWAPSLPGLSLQLDVVRIALAGVLTVGVLAVVTELTVGMP